MSKKAKFKVGDKVKMLQSAVNYGVSEREVGKVTEIKAIYSPIDIRVYDSRGKDCGCWSVNEGDISIVIIPGQQLLFNFMG